MADEPKVPATAKAAKAYQTEGGAWWAGLDQNENTPELVWPRSIEVYDLMRRTDPQILAMFRAVTLPIRRTQWRIEPNGARADVVKLVAEDLGLPIVGDDSTTPRHLNRTRDRFDFADYLRLSLLKLVFGHSFFEQVYRIERTPTGARQARLGKLLWIPPRTIGEVKVESDGGLAHIKQREAKNGVKIEVGELVAHVSDREGGNWLGQSLLRPAYKFWILKDRLLRVQAQTVERNGMGVPTFTDRDHTASGQLEPDEVAAREQAGIAAGLAIARAFRSGDTAGAALVNGQSLTLNGVAGKLPDAMTPIRYYDDQIARAFLANFLSLGGDDSTGSYALGNTFRDFFTMSLDTVALEFAAITNQHVIEDLVDLNFGRDAKAPRLVFEDIASQHAITAEGIRALVECGALTPDDDLEAYLRDTSHLPKRDPDTARVKAPAAAPTAPDPAPAGDPDTDTDTDTADGGEETS